MRPARLTLFSIVLFALSAITVTAQRTREPTDKSVPIRPDPSKPIDTQTRPLKLAQELRCRGGSSLQFDVRFNVRQTPAGQPIDRVAMVFMPGKNAAGPLGGGLQPGECSWVDRGMDASDNQRVVSFYIEDRAQPKAVLNGMEPELSSEAAETTPDARTIPRYLSTPDHYWSFWVTASDSLPGYFDTQRHRYWKKPRVDRIPNRTVPMKPPLD